MKRALCILALAFISLSASAQEQETLFNGDVDHGGFGAVVLKLTPLRGDAGLLMGGYGGWLINHHLMLGVGGFGLVSNVRASADAQAAYHPAGDPLYVEFGYGGFMMEYMVFPHKLVHFGVQALIGAGAVTYRENWYDGILDDNPSYRHYGLTEAVFTAEPSIHAELYIAEWMRIHAGAGYRFVTGLDDLKGISNKDLSGPSLSFALKFGLF